MGRLLLVVVILLALVLALFGVQNPQTVNVRFLGFNTGYVPLYVVILLSTLAGIILSAMLGIRGRVSSTLRTRRLERQVAELEQRLEARSKAVVVDVPDPITQPAASSREG